MVVGNGFRTIDRVKLVQTDLQRTTKESAVPQHSLNRHWALGNGTRLQVGARTRVLIVKGGSDTSSGVLDPN